MHYVTERENALRLQSKNYAFTFLSYKIIVQDSLVEEPVLHAVSDMLRYAYVEGCNYLVKNNNLTT